MGVEGKVFLVNANLEKGREWQRTLCQRPRLGTKQCLGNADF